MMELYIRVENGHPVNHPILKENLLQAFPGIDLSNNTEYVQFERVMSPALGPYDKSITHQYAFVNGVYRDVWTPEPMSAAERIQKQNQTKLDWQEMNLPSWVFNEETCSFDPPVPRPEGEFYVWNEENQSWENSE